MPGYDRDRIAQLEERLAVPRRRGERRDRRARDARGPLPAGGQLRARAGDDRAPAGAARRRATLSAARRAALESKAIACRLAPGRLPGGARAVPRAAAGESRDRLARRCARGCTCSARDALFRLGRIDECRERGRARRSTLADAGAATSRSSAGALNLLGRGRLPARATWTRARDLLRAGAGALPAARRRGQRRARPQQPRPDPQEPVRVGRGDRPSARRARDLPRGAAASPRRGRRCMNLGIVHQKSGDWARAAECYRAGRAGLRCRSATSCARATSRSGSATWRACERRFDDAESAAARRRSSAPATQGARREEVLALEFLGELEFDRGRPETALARYHEALALAERIAPEGDLVVELERRRAEALCALGRLDEAERALRARAPARAPHRRPARVRGRAPRRRRDRAGARPPRRGASQSWTHGGDAARRLPRAARAGPRPTCALGRATDDPREARRYLYRAGALFAELSTPYWLEQAERELQRLLGPAPSRRRDARRRRCSGRRHRAPGLVACSHAMRRVETLARRAAAHRAVGADHRRDRHRQGADRAHHPLAVAARRRGRSSRSTAARCAPTWRCRSCSATARARSPARTPRASGWSRRRTAARCSWTRSASCRSTCR